MQIESYAPKSATYDFVFMFFLKKKKKTDGRSVTAGLEKKAEHHLIVYSSVIQCVRQGRFVFSWIRECLWNGEVLPDVCFGCRRLQGVELPLPHLCPPPPTRLTSSCGAKCQLVMFIASEADQRSRAPTREGGESEAEAERGRERDRFGLKGGKRREEVGWRRNYLSTQPFQFPFAFLVKLKWLAKVLIPSEVCDCTTGTILWLFYYINQHTFQIFLCEKEMLSNHQPNNMNRTSRGHVGVACHIMVTGLQALWEVLSQGSVRFLPPSASGLCFLNCSTRKAGLAEHNEGSRGESLYLFIRSPSCCCCTQPSLALLSSWWGPGEKEEVDAKCCGAHGNASGTETQVLWPVSRCPINPHFVFGLSLICSACQMLSHSAAHPVITFATSPINPNPQTALLFRLMSGCFLL